jgi:hypothetical protein
MRVKKGVEHPHGDLVAFLKGNATPLDIPWLLPSKAASGSQVRFFRSPDIQSAHSWSRYAVHTGSRRVSAAAI